MKNYWLGNLKPFTVSEEVFIRRPSGLAMTLGSQYRSNQTLAEALQTVRGRAISIFGTPQYGYPVGDCTGELTILKKGKFFIKFIINDKVRQLRSYDVAEFERWFDNFCDTLAIS